MRTEIKSICRGILLSLAVLSAVVIVFTVISGRKVAEASAGRIYCNVDSVPHNRVALLLGTSPLNRYGRPNSYFTNRIAVAAGLYHAGKVDFIIASGDNHIREYDEPTAMRDSLMARGVPESRIILDFAGFRTLDSVVRAKEVFGCDSLTIISQADHCARALYLAEANGIAAVGIAAPVRAGRWVRTRLALREWLARDRMMLDIWLGKRPHFLGGRIEIPRLPVMSSYSTTPGFTMEIVNPENLTLPLDSIVLRFSNTTGTEAIFGEWYEIQHLRDSVWTKVPYGDKYRDTDGTLYIVWNSIAYISSPHSRREEVVKPRLYRDSIRPGVRYRLAKDFWFGEYTGQKDTAYVEFEVR